jgi:hypothetical protein
MCPSPQRQSDPVERECEEPQAAGRAAQSCSSPRREDQASNAIQILALFGMVGSDPDSGLIIPLPDPWPDSTCTGTV